MVALCTYLYIQLKNSTGASFVQAPNTMGTVLNSVEISRKVVLPGRNVTSPMTPSCIDGGQNVHEMRRVPLDGIIPE